jgi:hypothetical protein
MKVAGLVVIIVGTFLLLYRGVDFKGTQDNHALTAFGAIKLDNEQQKKMTWPLYAAGIAIIGGIGLVAADKSSRETV